MIDDANIALKREFLAAASEILSELAGIAGDLRERQVLAQLVRAARTLHGAARIVGFEPFSRTVEAVEAVLSRVHDGAVEPTIALASALGGALAVMKAHVDALSEDFDAEIDAHAALAALGAAARGDGHLRPLAASTWTEAPVLSGGAAPIVLVCDDDPEILDFFRTIFELTSYEVRLMESPATALGFVESHKIDLLITDLIMPGMNGLTLITKVRALDPTVPVLLCSGFAEREDLLHALRLGALDFFDKPFSPQKVLATVKSALDDRRAMAAMLQLAGANFRAFVMAARLVDHLPEAARGRFEDCLEEIGRLTHALLGKGAA